MPLSDWGGGTMAELVVTQDFWLALLLTYPSPTDTGTDLNEPTAADYDRVYLDPALWSAAETNVCTFDAEIIYNPAADWGTATSYALCTAITAGEVFFFEYLTPPVLIRNGSTLTIASGLLAVEVV